MANKANKINKQRIDETFDSLRYVDKMFNKAGGVLTESKKPISLEEKLKRSILKEAEGEDTQEINIDFVDSEGEETEFNFELEDGQIVDLDTDFDLDEVGSETESEPEEGEETELESEEDFESEESEETEESELENEFTSEEDLETEEGEELNEYNELHPSGEYGGVQSSLNPDSEMSEEELEEAVNNLMMEADELEDNNPLEGETTEVMDDNIGSEEEMGDLGSDESGLDSELEGENLESEEGEDLGDEGLDMGGMSSGPSMDMGGSDMVAEDQPDLAASTSISSPQDIDQLINSIVEEQPLTENKELKALGYQDLKDKELIGNKVKMESVKKKNIKALTEAIEKRTGKKVDLKDKELIGNKVKMESVKKKNIKALTEAIEKRTGKKVVLKENDETIGNGMKPATKLVDKFGKPGSVEGSSSTQEKPNHAAKAKVVKSVGGFTLMELGEEEVNSSTPTQTISVKKVNADGDFKASKLKEESVIKNKALLSLADKYVTLSEAHDKLMLENYKLKKANSLLTVLPELNETTKLQIIKKFDSCKTLKEAKELYVSVTGMLKEHKGVSSSVRNLNEAVIKRSSNVKYLGESLAGPSVNGISDELSNPDAQAQRRIDLLSGIGNEDDYGVGAY